MYVKKLRVKYVVSLIAVIGIALLGAHRSSESAATKKELKPADIQIINKTKSLEVIGIEKAGDDLLQVTLKNSYNKTITAFQSSFGAASLFEELLVNSNGCIGCLLPGATYVRLFPAVQSLTIFAVVFEDGSGEGDPPKIKEVIDIRSGKSKAFRHFVSTVQKVVFDSGDQPLTDRLSNLKREFANSDGVEDTASSDERYGFESGRKELLGEIQRIEKEGAANGDMTIRLRKHAEDMQRFSQRLGQRNQNPQ